MSLKAFHLVFIMASCLLAFGCGVWELKNFFSVEGTVWDLVFGIAALVAGVALIIYERYFLKKFKDVSYL
jgi:uncharacterized membrane protein HdeD (DUF308 family)